MTKSVLVIESSKERMIEVEKKTKEKLLLRKGKLAF